MKKKNSTDQQFANIEEGLSKTEQFVEDNRNIIISIIGFIILIFIIIYGYKNFYQIPLNTKAQKELFVAEQYFEKDSFQIALHGNENFVGLINIIEEYKNTKSGKLALYYSGISYLHLGEYTNAIKMLEKYDSDDQLLLSIATTAIGDAFSEMNQPKEAIEYYKKSINIHNNELTTPRTLMKCAKIYETEQNFEEAHKCYNKIKSDFPEAIKNIEKYIHNTKTKKQ